MEIEFSETKGAAFVPNGSCHRQKPFATSRDCSDVLLLDLQAMGNSNAYGGGPTQTPAEQSSLTCTSGPSSNEEKRGRWLLWGFLISGWLLSAALLILLIAAFLRAQSASQACDASPLPDEAMPILPPSSGIIRQSLTPLTPSTLSASEPASAADQMCRQGRSRPIHGSGATVCYEGYTGAIKRHLDFFPGDGACASCSGSNDADACTACYPGFSLLVTDPEKCSGMCVMSNGSEATAPPASSCIPQQAGGSLQGCLKHDDQPLCYDLQDNCKFRVAWDDGLCVGHLARACKATCGQCGEPSGSDPHLRALLLAWRSTLTLGPGSPLGWGWKEDKALDEWPGVSTGSAISGGFLKELSIKDYDFRGQLPVFWGGFYRPDLRMRWQMSHNQITGTLPGSWSRVLSHLSLLDLSYNQLTGTVPLAWADEQQHQSSFDFKSEWLTLDLNTNMLTGELQAVWFSQGPLRSVVSLNLGHNKFSGSLPPEWTLMHPELEMLNLASNHISGSIPPEYSVFSNLQVLRLDHNRIAGTLPETFSNMRNLKRMDLQSNNLSGTLPGAWSSLNNWGTIWNLSDNNLGGSIPSTWSNMDMKYLELQDNQLSGPLPLWLPVMDGLVGVDLSNNRFSGSLPASWSSCTSLRRLSLGNNTLTGTIPGEWSTLSLLDVLELSWNLRLEGPVPLPEGAHVGVDGTSLEWNATSTGVWNRHRSRWQLASDLGDEGLSAAQNQGECSFCRNLLEASDQCQCVRDCCKSLGDKSLCSQDFENILDTQECQDPCGYCWSFQHSVDRITCFHSCCADSDDDDLFPMYSNDCHVFSYNYEYDDDYN